MKMPDGGFRPAYNVQLATDQAQGVIVGVSVVREGTDAGQALPMEEQVMERTGQHPKDYLMDGGFATKEAITLASGSVEETRGSVTLARWAVARVCCWRSLAAWAWGR